MEKKKILFIGDKQKEVKHGWDQVNRRNQLVLESVFGDVVYMPLGQSTLISRLLYFDISNNYLQQIDKELQNGYDYVFICQSLYGRVCRFVKKNYPKVKIITFFHNVERQYAEEFLKVSSIKAIPYYLRVCKYEKMAAKYSDYCITLNERDSDLLKRIYGRKADLVLPTTLEDKFVEGKKEPQSDEELIDYLFVGTAFYPNIEGMQWFINNVLPRVGGKLCIVGKDMSSSIFSNLNENVSIYGFVDDLAAFYRRAKMIVSPIFHGGGMKTKTAEALMWGKLILGSKEAFEGYEINPHCMVTCNTEEDYINAINKNINNKNCFNIHAREEYLKHCSYQSSIALVTEFFNK